MAFFSNMLTIKRKGVLLINVYFVAVVFLYCIWQRYAEKNFKIIDIVCSFPLQKQKRNQENENPHIQINQKKIVHLNYMFLWLRLMWILFSRLFRTESHFFTTHFFDRDKKASKIGQEKDVWIGNFFRAQSYEFVWCKAINHPNNLRNQKKIDAFFPLFPPGLTMQVANYPDYDGTSEKKI